MSSGAFTLVELLVVLAIIAILTALTIPAISGSMRAYQLEITSQSVVNQLSLGRQDALSKNRAVQVRFYYLPDYNQAADASPAVYRGMQCFTEGDATATGTATLTAITKPIFFAAPIILSTATSPNNLSPLLPGSPTSTGSSDPSLSIYQLNYKYASFHFKADGTTDLKSTLNSITLVTENDKAGPTGLPNNYRTLQIDPMIGTVRAFRP